jgi:hypothetical protein
MECDEKENNGEKRIEWNMTGIEDIFSAGAESDEGGREDLQEGGGAETGAEGHDMISHRVC